MSCITAAVPSMSLPIGVGEEHPDVVRIQDEDDRGDRDGEHREDIPAHPSLGGVGPELAPDDEPRPDDRGQVVQHLGQVAADLPLDEDGGDQDPDVDQDDPVGHGQDRVLEGQAEALLLEGAAELAGDRVPGSRRPPS